ncbi:MAG: dihydroorotate dehydrogenase electron transfer subunit [Oscillospiraceae bacterium]
MIKTDYKIEINDELTKNVFLMQLSGNTGAVKAPGQFINIAIDGLYLRRPISVCDWGDGWMDIIYKVVGKGTEQMSKMPHGTKLNVLSGLGNGFDTGKCAKRTAVIGGGVGIPPLFGLAKQLLAEGKSVTAVLGFNRDDEIFLADAFAAIGCETVVTTLDGSFGVEGLVTDALPGLHFDYFCACGPEAMLRAVYEATETSGQMSFEERMGCGFGACMGCSCRTKYGNKRICKEGPVLEKEEIIW